MTTARLSSRARGGALCALGAAALAACASDPPPVEGIDPFRDALAAEYQALYAKELALTDWNDWPRFRRLRDAALAGERPALDDLSARDLSPEVRAELEGARARLVNVLMSPAEAVDAAAVAASVGAYECWVEEAEENRDLAKLVGCRARFAQRIAAAEIAAATPIVALLPSGAPSAVAISGAQGDAVLDAPFQAAVGGADGIRTRDVDAASMRRVLAGALRAEPRPPRSYLIYFKTGGAEMTEASMKALDAAIADVAGTEAARLTVFGHTDTVGGATANARISRRRAEAVREVLIGRGLPADAIRAEGFGERDLLIDTPDSTDEARNRRVEIVVR